MQADEFEKNIQNKMEGFGLVPNDEVWKQVLIRIKKEKKKRKLVFFWLFIGFVLIAGTSVFYFINNKANENIVIDRNTGKRVKQADSNIEPTTPNFSVNVFKAKTGKKREPVKKDNIKRMRGPETRSYAFTKITNEKVINNEFKALNTNPKRYISNAPKEKKHTFKSLPPHKFYNPQGTKTKADTTVKNSVDEKTDSTKNTSSPKIVKETWVKKQLNKKWKLSLNFYGGLSDYVSNLFVSQNKSSLDPNSPLDAGNFNSGVNAASIFKPGFSLGLGIFEKRQLAKKISISAGIVYHLYTIKSVVGSRVNQPVRFYDSSLQSSTSVNSYYTIGNSQYYNLSNSENYSNNYHFLQLPVNLGYQINKKQDRPLIISAGLSPGYLVNSTALYINRTANVYYVDQQKFKRFQLSAQMSLSFPIIRSSGYLVSAGPAVKYGFTSASKAVSRADEHLFFAGINANLTLN